MLEKLNSDAQNRFEKKYITGNEIEKRLNINRANVLYARARGKLPGAIAVGRMYIWERESIEIYLASWDIALKARRGQLL